MPARISMALIIGVRISIKVSRRTVCLFYDFNMLGVG